MGEPAGSGRAMIHATKRVLGENDFLNYLDSFRYLLAGEFAFRRDLLNDMRVPSDWGLEMGVASEMYRNNSTNVSVRLN